ncbi:MAG: polysaccharide biosynthesis/export family protein [Phycisphaerales bacterium]
MESDGAIPAAVRCRAAWRAMAAPVARRALAGLCLLGGLVGCEVNGFFDPSKTGSFSTTPTTMPVLTRIDVIEGESGGWKNATPPTQADQLPNEALYRLAPGDVLRIEVYELQRASETSTTTRPVDQNGNVRLPTIGDIPAAGMTPQEVQEEIVRRLRPLIPKPQVSVALDEERSLQFTVLGRAAANPGPYRLTRPDVRLLEALAIAGGVADVTDKIYIVRRVPLDESVASPYRNRAGSTTGGGGAATGGAKPTTPGAGSAPKPVDIESLINQLDNKAGAAPVPPPNGAPPAEQPKPPMGMLRQNTAPPVDVDDVVAPGAPKPGQSPPTSVPPRGAGATGQPSAGKAGTGQPSAAPPSQPGASNARPAPAGDSFVFDQSRNAWVRVPAGGVRPNGAVEGAAGPRANTTTGTAATAAPGGSIAVPGGDDILDDVVSAEEAASATGPDGAPLFAERIIEIDYKKLISGDSRLNVVVRPNDLIYVQAKEVGFVYIEGEILRPGSYDLPPTGGLTLSRLVAAAGGLGPIAIPERVDLTRTIGEYREATVRLNLGGIRRRTEPDILLKPGDHIIIGTNFWATPLAIFRNGFRMTYGFGFLLDRNFGNDVFGPPPENFGNNN